MVDKELIEKIRRFKEERGYTLYDLAKRVDIQPSTLERWFRTCRINRVYADLVRKRLGIK